MLHTRIKGGVSSRSGISPRIGVESYLTSRGHFHQPELKDFVSLVAVLLLVLIVELVNSAIESVVDRIGFEHHELSGRAKDLGSAAVSLALFVAALSGLLSFISFLLVEPVIFMLTVASLSRTLYKPRV